MLSFLRRAIPKASSLGLLKKNKQLLLELCSSKTPLEASFSRYIDSSETTILDINPIRKILIVDDFFPRPHQAVFKPGNILNFTSIYQGKLIIFDSAIIRATKMNEHVAYEIQMPSEMMVHRRRKSERAKVPKDSGVKVKCFVPLMEPMFATIKDVSADGIKLSIAGDKRLGLKLDGVIQHCEIELARDKKINCQLRIKNLVFGRIPFQHTAIGAEFENLEQAMKEELLNAITEWRILSESPDHGST